MLHTSTSSRAPVGALLLCLAINTLAACDSGRLAGSQNGPTPRRKTLDLAPGGGSTDDCGGAVWCPPPPDNGCDPGEFCPDAVVDAGSDAGPEEIDAGTVPDSGVDAGTVADAGTEVDAGAEVDAGTGEEDLVTVQNFGARGEFTSPSFLTTAPPGAALLAQNVVVDVTGEYTTARGFERLPAGIPGDYEISAWTVYQGAVIAHVRELSTLYRYVSGAWTAYAGTYAAPSPGLDANGDPIDGQVKFFETQQALYFTTSLGLYRIEGVTETPTLAGVVQALPGVATVSAAGQALSTSSATAYRYVWGRRATNGRIMLGAPSSRVTISNRSEGFTFSPTATPTSLVRASNIVTVKVTSGQAANLVVGQVVDLTATAAGADAAAFPLGAKTIASVGATSFTYAETGANATAATPASASFTSVATDVDIQHVIPIPSGVDATYFIQVYRADQVPLNVTPTDEMYLVHEEAVEDMLPGATSYTFVDATPDALKGDALYTNVNSGGSIGASHYAPPKAAVSTVFSGRAVYANTELKERIAMTLLGVSGQNGLKIGQGLKFIFEDGTSESYTADTFQAAPSTFKLFTDGTPSQNVVNTLASLAYIISTRSGGRIYARNEEGGNGIIGGLFVESRAVAEGPISVEAVGNGSAFTPALPSTFGADFIVRAGGIVSVNATTPVSLVVGQQITLNSIDPSGTADFPLGVKTVTTVFPPFTFTYAEAGPDAAVIMTDAGTFGAGGGAEVQTDDEAAPGGFMVSDNANPDSVPATLPEIAGDRYKRILRMLQVGNALFFLKEDGLFRLIGTDPTNYTVDCVDPTIRFVAPRAAWVLNGRAYALTSQGLASWTESSNPEPAALQIEDQLRAAVEHFPTLVDQTAFAISHESKRRAYLWLPDEEGTANAVLHVFNATEDAWTKWTKPAVDVFIHPTEDRLYLANPNVDGSGTAPAPSRERNTGTSADYQDEDGNAIEALVTWLPTVPPESTLQQQLVRASYHFRNTVPTTVDVGYSTPWVPEPLWFELTPEYSTSPGVLTTPPDQDHSRGDMHTLSIRHAVVNEPLRLLGFSAQLRFWTRRIP